MPYVDEQASLTLSRLLSDGANSLDRMWAQRRASGWVGDAQAEADDALAGSLEAAATRLSVAPQAKADRDTYLSSLPTRGANPTRVSDVILDGQFARDLLAAIDACNQVVATSREHCDDLLGELGSARQALEDREYLASHHLLTLYTGVVERLEAAIASICRATQAR